MIMPTRCPGGKGLDDFRDEMLNDIHIRELHDWLTPDNIFPDTNIRGAFAIFYGIKIMITVKTLHGLLLIKITRLSMTLLGL